jgi:pyruvate,orthophosphate dikinase
MTTGTKEGSVAIETYRFSGELCDWKETDLKTSKTVLGGKGAALVLMAQAGMPVPPGFTIPTDVCNLLARDPSKYDAIFAEMFAAVETQMGWLSDQFGYAPLVSVRSGAPVSMPGMMDTILNVGLTADNQKEWVGRLGERTTLDSQRRLIQMLGATAYGVPHEVFEFQLAKLKKSVGATDDAELTAADLSLLVEQYCTAFFQNKGFDFPINDAKEQLRAAVKAVFDSWMNERAIEYRKINRIDQDMGTAVNIQAMVFGNMGDDSGTGVLFTRNPSTGENLIMGEFLQNAQGEDVVAGIRTPRPLKEMDTLGGHWQQTLTEIGKICVKLEEMYLDMVDVEFTVQSGKLFVLQSRAGKRSARAAFKIATDLVAETVIDRKTALSRLTREQFKVVRRPSLDPSFKTKPSMVGLPACPGVVTGKPVFSSKDAVASKEPCILITHETTPDDIKGMAAAIGILTQTGGATSHAAVVARAMDKTCITGCTALDLQASWKDVTRVTIDGATGNVWLNVEVPVIDSSDAPEVRLVMDWCLDQMDAFLGVPADQEFDGKHAIQAASWWGSKDAAEAVLDGLAALPSRENVVLDMRGARELMPASDMGLMNCFGDQDAEFGVVLKQALTARKDALSGLRLWPGQIGPLTTAGFGMLDKAPKIVPADYAAFAVLAD